MQPSHYAFCALLLGLSSVAPAASAQDSCNAHFTRSSGLTTLVSDAYAAMSAKTSADYVRLLPGLEKELNALPAAEIKPEVCDGNHINAYTVHQYAELSALKAHGVPTGFPADLPIVKQPDLNQAGLAYAVGWIKYEQSDFAGAQAAYAKGLALFPHDVALQQENLAVLMQLARYADVIAFADKILTDGTAMDDVTRGKSYSARGLALYSQGDLKGADDMMGVSLKYNNIADTQTMQATIRDALAKKN